MGPSLSEKCVKQWTTLSMGLQAGVITHAGCRENTRKA